jgi:LPS export ABC transporter permease LptG/LPS export ABC transporter permease LptF
LTPAVLVPSRISRYVLKELSIPTLLGLLLYTFVLLMNHFFLVAEQALSKNLGPDLTLRLFAIGIPKVLVLSIPMAVLLGCLIGVGKLSADHEWVALQSAGLGPSVLVVPLVLHGLIGTLLCFWIYAVVVPRSNFALANLRGELLSRNIAADLRPRVFFEDAQDAVLFVNEIKPGGQRRLEGVLCIQTDRTKGTTQLSLARYGDLYPADDDSDAIVIDLYQGEARQYEADPAAPYVMSGFSNWRDRLKAPSLMHSLKAPEKSAQDMELPELWSEIRATAATRDPHDSAEQSPARRIIAEKRHTWAMVELQQRFALPLASLIFAILAIPLGITGGRSGKGAGFALSIAVVVLYRAIFVVTRNQALHGNIPPSLGPWMADAVTLAWALIAFRRLRWGAGTASRAGLFGLRLPAWLRPRKRPQADVAEAAAPVDPSLLAQAMSWTQHLVDRVDRYIGSVFLRMLALALASTYAIYVLIELQDMMDEIIKNDQSPTLVLHYFKYYLPTVLPFTLPISCLIAAIVTVAVLSRSSELVAMQSAGISMRRATAPILLLTLACCGALFVVQDRIVPTANRRAQAIKDRLAHRAPRTYNQPAAGQWIFGPDGRKLYHFRLYDPEHEEFQTLSVLTVDWSVPRIVDQRFAPKARWTPDGWQLDGGWYRTFEPNRGGSHLSVYTDPYLAEIDMPRTLVTQRSRMSLGGNDLPDKMSLAELDEQIEVLSDSGYDLTVLRVAFHNKFAHAAAPLVMVLLGLPFAFRVGRRGSLYAIGVGLLLVIVYWATYAVFRALGLETLLPPVVAAWGPNLFYGLLGTHLLLYVKT